MQPEDVLLIWGALSLGLLILFIWGEIKAERYWDEVERKIDSYRKH